MSGLTFSVLKPGMFSTVQDIGRWGHQGKGMPVAGAMDQQAVRIGNILVGNDEGAAALEITLVGPTLSIIDGDGVIAVAGAELGCHVNGHPVENWTVLRVAMGDVLSFHAPISGCRAYLCVSGGIDVPLVMGSRSTYIRAKIGGFDGRSLRKGDILRTGEALPLWRRCEGMICPEHLRPARDTSLPIGMIPGLQEDLFTEKGKMTFYGSEYVISSSADRMGYRLTGPVIEHRGSADIVSDAIPLGAVQVPGHGRPIVMLADRQTTGGYTKIGVVCSVDTSVLSQRLPGQKVHFVPISLEEGIQKAREEAMQRDELLRMLASYRTAPIFSISMQYSPPCCGEAIINVNGRRFHTSWKELPANRKEE